MPHPVTCGACNATFSIPDEVWDKRVHGQVATLKCRQCKAPIEVDGRVVRRGSAVNISASAAATPAVVHPTPQAATTAELPKSAAAEPQRDKSTTDASKPIQPNPPEPKAAETKPAQVDPPLGKGSVLASQASADLGRFSVKEPGPVTHPLASGHQAAKPEDLTSKNAGWRSISAAAIASAKSDNETARELSWAPPSEAQFANRKAPERSPTRPALPSNVSIKSVQESTPKPKPAGHLRTEAKSSPHASEPDRQRDSADLWVVSFDAEDDRELTTSQLLEAIAKGTVSRDTIVWREGMDDWLAIARVPELAKHLRHEQPAVKPGSVIATDDGDDETIIYRPGSKVASAVAKTNFAVSAPTKTSKLGGAISRTEPTAARLATPQTHAEGTPRGPSLERAPRAVALSAPSLTGAASHTAAGPAVTSSPEVVQGPFGTFAAKAAASVAKSGGGPPPLRRAQPSRPDDVGAAPTPWSAARGTPSADEVVTSVQPIFSASAAASPPPLPVTDKQPIFASAVVASPPPLPVADQSTSAGGKPAIFPPPAQSPASPVHSPHAFSLGRDDGSHELRATPSFAPRPSDFAALTKIRPKFPKWLPFAVLGGLVLLVAIMAALSWRAGDNPDSADRKSPSDSAALPLDNSPGRLGPSSTVAQSKPDTASKPADLSAGFANKFAQAAAKQRPSARFDKEVAEKALAPGFTKAASCHNKGDPTGVASVTLSIAPSGQVLSVTVASPFTTTFTAECIRNALRDITVPPFQGSPGRLAHSITIH